jgi:Peptidase family M28/PA domain/PDZ domain/WD40-like Beta Propeller Repeat
MLLRLPARIAPLAALCFWLTTCAGTQVASGPLLPDEAPYLEDLKQLTFGGENAEAYWSFDGTQLSMQIRREGEGCDRIYRMPVVPESKSPIRVSQHAGATTCAHFFPGGGLLYASTHLAGEACPPRPDMSQGYVWAVYDSYDIFSAKDDGSGLLPLTNIKGYDAEGTVCARDGSIIFTSTRDGDLELYRMDKDGQNVKRLTHTPGYDGGAFFNADCTKIVWRASRPRPGKELDDYKALLAKGLVRPSKLEIWIASADGNDAMQLTNLDAASFAPSFHPTEDAIVFSSNFGDRRGREFDLWAMRTDGSGLRKITHAPGFDGFPHFSPDGRLLAFSSNRATAEGKNDTNVFLARWKGLGPLPAQAEAPVDRIRRDVHWLADPARQGRGVETPGLEQAGAYLEDRLKQLGLEPAGDAGSFRQRFPVVTAVDLKPTSTVVIGGKPVDRTSFAVLGFSAEGKANAPLVLAGYGIVAPEHKIDDYAGLDVKGKVVLVRRYAPEDERTGDANMRRRLGDLRRKAWVAREKGAVALVVVDWPLPPRPAPPDWQPAAESPLLPPSPSGSGDAGLPVLMVKRVAVADLLPRLMARQPVTAALDVGLQYTQTQAFNVVGRIRAGKQPADGTLVVGAHYDHLGLGGRFSLAPDKKEPHVGADDNASGTAAVLEVARALAARKQDLRHDVIVALFSAEESGLLGSAHYTKARADELKRVKAMINLDMVGRLRAQRVDVLGSDSATEWSTLVRAACVDLRLQCNLTGDGQGPSDQASFYAAGIPVLHFFTGAHTDYHKPTDVAGRLNAAGAATIASLTERVMAALDVSRVQLTYQKGKSAPPGGDARSFGASLGTIPDYGGPPAGKPGVLLAGVRPGGGADKAGIRRGDVIVKIGPHDIRSVEDLMYALQAFKPGETTNITLVREQKPVKLEATFQEPPRRH